MLSLRDYQLEHFEQMKTILQRSYCAVDNSSTGRGKTIVALSVAKHLQLPVVVVTPVTTIEAWQRAHQMVVGSGNATLVRIMGYEALRGVGRVNAGLRAMKHGLLTRKDVRGVNGKVTTTYTPTLVLKQLISVGTLFVFDEFHNLKNTSTQNKAASTISRLVNQEVRANPGAARSRCMMLSATPLDKVEHAVNFIRLMGLTTHHMLASYNPQTREMQPRAIEELRNEAMAINAMKTIDIMTTFNFYGIDANSWTTTSLKRARAIAYELYVRVILPFMSSAMPPAEAPRFVRRGFFEIRDAENKAKVTKAVNDLRGATRFDEQRGGVVLNGDTNWGAITKALMDLEVAQIADMCRVAIARLQLTPGLKVILAMGYKITIDKARRALKAAGFVDVAELTGDVPPAERQAEIDRFNTSDTCRAMVMTTQTGGIGINLHDTQGGRKRVLFILPDYKVISIHQCVGRIFRYGALSEGEAYVFYSQHDGGAAANIMTSLAKKSVVIRSVLSGDENKAQELPGEYPVWVEPSNDMAAVARVNATVSSLAAPRSIDEVVASVPSLSSRHASAIDLTDLTDDLT
jgi:superfamily II DNA or RNA helicase